ncbi:MAG TPA: protein kinase [Ktedonobacteraceae bacterium]|nr:protein kinase [Ktedonobacteraceae bacterium]
MNDLVGQQLGNYRLLRLLGQGGQASVYLGEHIYLKSPAAVKVRHAVLSDEERAVFLREAQMLVRMTHPHIVRVLDFALQDGMPFLVMEYAPHGTLRQRHPRGTRLPLDVIIPYVNQVASALQYTHDQRLIHRDVKPENMLLNSHDEVLLSDFGLVILTTHSLSSEGTELMEQSLAGTTPYLAPEQLRGKARPASDQYALGVVVYEWLCGKPPFRGPFLEVAVQHVSVPPPSMHEQVPDLPPAIEEVVLRALAKEPEQRFARVQDFAAALEHASRQAVSPHLTPVLAQEYGVETGHRQSSMRTLPSGTVTMLFTDMEGSTRLLQQMGDRYAGVLAECRHLLRAAFQHWGGHEVDTQGDAFFVVFARATDALSAAVHAQRALASHPWPEGVVVRVRMGLHTGEPQLASEGYVGLDVHRAARIMSAGHGGQVLFSQTTRDLVEQDLPDNGSLLDLGEHRLKDLRGPQRLFQLVISDLPAYFPPLKTLDVSPNNLPVQPTPFIGRQKEVATVEDLLRREEVRLLTLTGPGGAGKTRLGLQVAAELGDRFPDGVFFVNLAPIREPEFFLPAIAQTLEVKETPEQSLLELLKAFLREKHVLLVLDNFEQIVSAAPHVATLLDACSKLKIMVTSREVLHVRAEHEFAVPPLALPDPKQLLDPVVLSQYEAVALFIERAQAVKPDFQMTNANAHTVAEICARLDGLPLAIELAAARMKLLSPQALLTRLGQRLQMLTSAKRDVPARQQTLRNTIAWSYQLLNTDEQRLFRRLSVFVGGCTLEAVEAVCQDMATNILDVVASLIDKSMLQQTEEEGEEMRLLMMETIREYGLETLIESGENEVTRHAHAQYYLSLAEEAEQELDGPKQVMWLERLEREHDNLRAALRWSMEQGEAGHHMEMALRLAGALRVFWMVHGHYSEGRTFLERPLACCEEVPVHVRAKALWAAAQLGLAQDDINRAEPFSKESLALYRELGDKAGRARAPHSSAFVARMRSDLDQTCTLAQEAVVLSREGGDKASLAASLHALAFLLLERGEYARAKPLFEENLALFKELGNKSGMAEALLQLAQTLFFSLGDQVRVRTLLEESHALWQEVGDKNCPATWSYLAGWVALNQGDTASARMLLEENLRFAREHGDRHATADALAVLGRIAIARGDLQGARALYEESLAVAGEIGDTLIIAPSLEGLAEVVANQGEFVWAARLWGAAEGLRATIGLPISPVERVPYEQAVAAARAQLGEKAFAAAWAEGRAMTPEQALAANEPVTIPAPVPTAHPSPPLEHA